MHTNVFIRMFYRFCRAEDCPPTDKPWLLSSVKQLRQDAKIRQSWKDKLSSTEEPFAFPGVESTFVEKMSWWVHLTHHAKQALSHADTMISQPTIFACAAQVVPGVSVPMERRVRLV